MISGELEWLVGIAQKSIKKNKKMFEASFREYYRKMLSYNGIKDNQLFYHTNIKIIILLLSSAPTWNFFV